MGEKGRWFGLGRSWHQGWIRVGPQQSPREPLSLPRVAMGRGRMRMRRRVEHVRRVRARERERERRERERARRERTGSGRRRRRKRRGPWGGKGFKRLPEVLGLILPTLPSTKEKTRRRRRRRRVGRVSCKQVLLKQLPDIWL